MSRVDVVIPCYNYARFLPQCVASVLSQEGVNIRVLIIDDCSSDESEAVGRLLAEQDRRIEFRRHPTNCGHIATYNEGLLGWASSEYSLLLSADDALAPGALARAAHVMDRHREVGMTYGMALSISGDESLPVITEAISNEYRILSGSEFLQYCFTRGNAVHTPTAVVRTELQHHLGGYRTDLPHSGDMEMWMRFAVHASLGVLRAVQGYYRRHSGNMSLQYYGRLLSDRREVIQACEEILDRWGAQFPESGSWRESMFERMGLESFSSASYSFDKGDIARYRAFLEFAEEVYPDIRGLSMWWKLRAKVLLGHALWLRIRPAWNRLRGRREIPSDLLAAAHSRTAPEGWWPGSP